MTRLSAEIVVGDTTYEFVDNLISVSFSGQDRSDTSAPSWGIKSNSGTIELYDFDGMCDSLLKSGKLSNAKINTFLHIKNVRKEQLGGFYISGARKDKQNQKLTIDFQDVLMSWAQKRCPRYFYPYKPHFRTLSDIVSFYTYSPYASGLKIANSETRTRLANIYIYTPLLEEGSLWAQMTKICEAGSCYIYCNNEGTPYIRFGGYT